jgi:putative phosphoesterase
MPELNGTIAQPVLTVQQKRVTLKAGRIGVISDTHGLLRPEALDALKGSELIIHAGDIGKPEVLASLKSIAPVLAIRGNNDREPWAKKIPDILYLQVNGACLLIIHNVNDLEVDPAAQRFHAVISGHSHKPSLTNSDGVVFLNPGSAGPRRFKLPVAVARLRIRGEKVNARIVELL